MVEFRGKLELHMSANMCDHLLPRWQSRKALVGKASAKAARIAEQLLGVTSRERHGAQTLGLFRPEVKTSPSSIAPVFRNPQHKHLRNPWHPSRRTPS